MLWADKYAPRSLSELTVNPELTKFLEQLCVSKNLPHLILHGERGSGRTTRAKAILRAVFGNKIDAIKATPFSPANSKDEFIFPTSTVHTQINAGELGNKDSVCMQQLIKEQAATASPLTFLAEKGDTPPYRVFVIVEAERLSKGAQAALRRTLECFVKTSRVILICQQLSALIPPLKSRCVAVRVPLPTEDEIIKVLANVVSQEQLSFKENDLRRIATQAKRNLRRALTLLEVASMYGQAQAPTRLLGWELQCESIAHMILEKPSLASMKAARDALYELLSALILGQDILECVTMSLLAKTSDKPQLQAEIIRAAAHYSANMAQGSKDVWHLEAFVANSMNFVKRIK